MILQEIIQDLTGVAEAEPKPSESDFSESEDDDFREALVDSESAGQETAPMTGPTSIAPLEGTFHTGLFPRAAAAALASIDDESAVADAMAIGKNARVTVSIDD